MCLMTSHVKHDILKSRLGNNHMEVIFLTSEVKRLSTVIDSNGVVIGSIA